MLQLKILFPDKKFSSITANSKEIKPGSLFIAVKGNTADGHLFINEAEKAGAAAIVGENELSTVGRVNTSYAQVPDSKLALAELAADFYGHPAQKIKIVGITGTSGKTTTTYMVESILTAAGFRVGLIGTILYRLGNKVMASTHTTPGAVELQKLLAEMVSMGCTAVAMEVSSHALKQHRVAGVPFDAMVFTNLSPEHLDFHPDMEDYFRTKSGLFIGLAELSRSRGKSPHAVINEDDAYGMRLLAEVTIPKTGFSLSSGSKLNASALKVDITGIHGEAGGVRIDSPLTGSFNIQNILAAVGAGLALGIAPDKISKGIAALKVVPGRLERVAHPKINVLVDYAHKPDALEKVLQAVRDIRVPGSKIITVFGCGGDRDRQKRPLMGKIAVENCDSVIITSDNPRLEDPAAIIHEIVAGAAGASNFVVESDRRRAIHQAINAAQPGDIVLIAGKGHENYQIIPDRDEPGKTTKIHFDDREVAADALRRL